MTADLILTVYTLWTGFCVVSLSADHNVCFRFVLQRPSPSSFLHISGSNLVPDDCGALPSTHMAEHLATNSDLILYEADIDHGHGYRCYRLLYMWLITPIGWAYVAVQGLSVVCKHCSCDEACCWVRKEYSTRTLFRVYPNRIVVNQPKVRYPYGYCKLR